MICDPHDFAPREQRLLTDASIVVARPNWNTDGESIVFERKDADRSELFRIGRDGTGVAPLHLCNEGATRVQGRPAFFGHDDFAYVSNRGGSLAIWRCDLKRGNVSAITRPGDGASDYGPAAPGPESGDFLFFRTAKGSEVPRIHRARLGEPHTTVTLGSQMGDQPWFVAPGTSFIFHSDRDGPDAVYRQPLEPRATAQRLGDLSAGTTYVTPFPSPDGRHVAFTHSIEGVQQIFVMRLDGLRARQVTFAAAPSMFPAWSPVRSELAYVCGDPTSRNPTGRLATLVLERVGSAASWRL